MTTPELIFYIQKQLKKNVSKDLIISKLLGVGWHKNDIYEAFLNIEIESKPKPNFIEPEEVNKTKQVNTEINNVDKYREELEKGDSSNRQIEIQNIELPQGEKTKVWTPMSIPVVKKEVAKVEEVKIEEPKLEVKELEIEQPKKEEPKNEPALELQEAQKEPQVIKQAEELIPTLISKDIPRYIPTNEVKVLLEEQEQDVSPTVDSLPTKGYSLKDLPKIAMLESYEKDVFAIDQAKTQLIQKQNQEKEQARLQKESQKEQPSLEKKVKNKKKINNWVVILLAVFLIDALVIWAFASGYINIKDIQIPFIKKDPKVLILNNSNKLASLQSYKTETNIEILSPSLDNISAGLIGGEVVPSTDKDSLLINVLGKVNKDGVKRLSDNLLTVKSSITKDQITSSIKNNELDLFIDVSDISKIMVDNSPDFSFVKINKNEFNLIPPLFPQKTTANLVKLNLYDLLYAGVSSYLDNSILSSYNDFINNINVIERDQEKIKNINTYHYSINADQSMVKNILNKIASNFLPNLSTEDQSALTPIIDSATLSSLDIWIGKKDNNIYQYNVVFNIPLSKIIGLDDKGIGDSQVSVNIKTTYYDFDVSNEIIMPSVYTTAVDFIDSINKTKMKNNVLSFKQLAQSLFNAEGSYGSKSNTKGDCMSPTTGSLFSPTGHTK